jgi:hypothetical protein
MQGWTQAYPGPITALQVQAVDDTAGIGGFLTREQLRRREFADTDSTAGIGDINSTAKGSGARFNAGKPPIELIPFTVLAAAFRGPWNREVEMACIAALEALGKWQAGGNVENLYDVFRVLGYDGWAECAEVFDYGRRKYAEWNWAKGMPWSAPLACAGRHLLKMLRGEQIDPESGKPHRGHVFCNVVMLATYAQTYTEGDDRPAQGLLG